MENDVSTRSTAEAPNPDTTGAGVAERIAQRTLAPRGAEYADEVRRLLDAGLEVMRQGGTDRRPRVADIVAEAGLSNDAFYRHFPSKDALVTAILEDGAERLCSYLAHQMTKSPDPRDRSGAGSTASSPRPTRRSRRRPSPCCGTAAASAAGWPPAATSRRHRWPTYCTRPSSPSAAPTRP